MPLNQEFTFRVLWNDYNYSIDFTRTLTFLCPEYTSFTRSTTIYSYVRGPAEDIGIYLDLAKLIEFPTKCLIGSELMPGTSE